MWHRCPIVFQGHPSNFKVKQHKNRQFKYSDAIISAMTSHITGVSIVYSTVCSGANQRKHQSSDSLVFVRGINQWLVNSPHKGPVTRKMFPFDHVIMLDSNWTFPDCNSSLNSRMATKWCAKLEVAKKRRPFVFQGHLSNFKVTWDKKS